MASGSPDLFVVCKSCGSEVSPYITECPYCGARLRKRAPKLDEPPGTGAGARRPRVKLTPIMPGEIPGITADPTRRPWVTAAIVVLSLAGAVVFLYQWFSDAGFLLGSDQELYRALWAPFVYVNEWYGLVVLAPIALFGWLLERRHGPLVVLALFVLTGMATYVVTTLLEPGVLYLGAPGGALGLLAAWAMPDVLRERKGIAHDGDLIGVAVLGIAVALMPAVVDAASVVQALLGLVIGALAGLLLSRTAGAR